MKRTFSFLLSLLMVISILVSVPVTANAASTSDISFTYDEYGGGYVITSCKKSASGKLVIPDVYKNKPVIVISDEAFLNCKGLTSVVIGKNVQQICWQAFSGCKKLTSITIPAGVTVIDGSVFSGCSALKTITVNKNNKNFVSVNGVLFNKTQTYLMKYPAGKTATSYTIPNKVEILDFGAFEGCKNLKSVKFGSKLVCIADEAFKNCTGLTSIVIPDSVSSIGFSAFENCANLKTVTLGKGVSGMVMAFMNCPKLTTVNVSKNNPNFVSLNGVVFSKDKKTLELYPAGKTATSYTVPQSVTSIQMSAFRYNQNLKSITLNNKLTVIGMSAFGNSKSLESITVPDSVKDLGYGAFENCPKLKTAKIGKNVTEIGKWFFEGSKALTNVTISSKNANYASVDGVVYDKKKTTLYLCPEGKSSNCYNIPKGVKTIGNSAFLGCKKIKGVKIPDTVTIIEGSAFSDCTALKSVTIPNSVEFIGSHAFYNCKNLTKAKLSNKVTDIAYGSFSGCTSLKEVKIPNSVKSIKMEAFKDCKNLKSVSLSSSLSMIDFGVFWGCKALTSIVIPNGVKTIYDLAFFDCTGLKSVKIPYTAEDISSKAFGYYYNTNTKKKAKIKDFKIYGKKDSAAQKYAKGNGFAFVAVTSPGATKFKSIYCTSSGVQIAWEKVKKADYYEVYRKKQGGSYIRIAITTQTSYVDKLVKNGQKYYYAIKSVNSAGESGNSNVYSMTFVANPTLKKVNSTKSGISVNWSKVTGAQGYVLYRKAGSGSFTKLATVNGISYTDKSAKKGIKYTYKVRSYIGKANSAYSNAITVTDKY